MAGQLVATASMLASGNYCTLSVLPTTSFATLGIVYQADRIISEVSWEIRANNGQTAFLGFLKFQTQGADGVYRDAKVPPGMLICNNAVYQGTWDCDIFGIQIVVPNVLTVAATAFLTARISVT